MGLLNGWRASVINKLIHLGFDCGVVKWVASFLSGVSDGITSGEASVTSGVPQGSVLGPALFLVYINDIVDAVKSFHVRLFADDTVVYRDVKMMQTVLLYRKI